MELLALFGFAQGYILKELDGVCGELNLQYCVTFGTAIGAIKHHGFIPWDDDIDVHIRIEDLDVLYKSVYLFRDNLKIARS